MKNNDVLNLNCKDNNLILSVSGGEFHITHSYQWMCIKNVIGNRAYNLHLEDCNSSKLTIKKGLLHLQEKNGHNYFYNIDKLSQSDQDNIIKLGNDAISVRAKNTSYTISSLNKVLNKTLNYNHHNSLTDDELCEWLYQRHVFEVIMSGDSVHDYETSKDTFFCFKKFHNKILYGAFATSEKESFNILNTFNSFEEAKNKLERILI